MYTILELKQKLSTHLPGLSAQLKMAPKHRAQELFSVRDKIHLARASSVLILLFHEQEELMIVFIKRSEYDGIHSGQIAFPGGKQEEIDENPLATALRETEEEIGISSKDIEIIGQLTELYLPPSNFLIQTYVGYCYAKPFYTIDPKEVDSVLEIKLNDILLDTNIHHKTFFANSMKSEVEAPYYKIEDTEIWGATAMICSEFIELIQNK